MTSTRDAISVVGRGGISGVLAWLAGYLFVSALTRDSIGEWFGTRVLTFLAGEDVTPKLVGWLFYNAHFVPVRFPDLLGGASRNFVTGDGHEDAVLILVLVPVVLVLAGVAAAWGRRADLSAGALYGATVVFGYLPLSALGVGRFEVTVQGFTAGPAFGEAVVFAGLAYPLVFGAVGGLLAAALASQLVGE